MKQKRIDAQMRTNTPKQKQKNTKGPGLKNNNSRVIEDLLNLDS